MLRFRLGAFTLLACTVSLAVAASAWCTALQASGHPQSCSSFGTSFEHSTNARFAKAGDPERITWACCKPTATAGISSCEIAVTLVDTLDIGCESVELNLAGDPIDEGTHVNCPRGLKP